MKRAADPSPDSGSFDRRMMRKALGLAARGRGLTSPNPMVGAVVVRDGQVVATGYHHIYGTSHAEVDALGKLGFSAQGCTLYVTLEPCCHQGMTPPCTSSVVSSGVSRVVVGMVDPNPLVSGRGVETLRAAGIDVTVGVLADECRELNRGFVKWIVTGRPWVTLKMAATIDGHTADRSGSSKWITGETARRDVHLMRAASDCVMVGAGTVIADDPLLLPVMVSAVQNPLRAVLSASGSLPVTSRLVASSGVARVILFASGAAPASRLDALRGAGVEVVQVAGGPDGLDLDGVMAELGKRRVTSVLVEGGHRIAASLLSAGLVDRLVVYGAPLVLADSAAPGVFADLGPRRLPDAMRFSLLSVRRLGDDVRLDFEPVR